MVVADDGADRHLRRDVAGHADADRLHPLLDEWSCSRRSSAASEHLVGRHLDVGGDVQHLLEALALVEVLGEPEAGAGDRRQRLAPAHEVARRELVPAVDLIRHAIHATAGARRHVRELGLGLSRWAEECEGPRRSASPRCSSSPRLPRVEAGPGEGTEVEASPSDTAAVLARIDAIHRPADLVVARPSADGILTIGTLLPDTGPGNLIGLAGINAVNVGVSTINEDGGVLGQPVQLVTASEGTSVRRCPRRNRQTAGQQRRRDHRPGLLAGHPRGARRADGRRRPGLLPHGDCARPQRLSRPRLFFRTVPSDSLTAQAMAAVALNTGVDSYAVVYLDDQFGRPFARQTISGSTGRRPPTCSSSPSRRTPPRRSSPRSPPPSPSARRGRSC